MKSKLASPTDRIVRAYIGLLDDIAELRRLIEYVERARIAGLPLPVGSQSSPQQKQVPL